jgi:hypothetical protein
MRDVISKLFAVPLFLALLTIAACSGSTVVTLTATPSSDPFITYRVGVASIQLQTSSGKPSTMILPAETTVDFTRVTDLSELVGAPSVPKGTYSGAEITLDYSSAQIIYDDGSLDGVALTPVDASGKALALARVTVTVDPSDPLRSAAKQASRLSLSFNLAASNLIDLSNATVTVTPLISASMQPIDTKQVRLNGPLLSANDSILATGVMPFDSTTAALGSISTQPSDTTTYEINGFVFTGAAGQSQIAALPANTVTTVFGTLTATNSASIVTDTTPTTTTPTTTTPTTTTPTTTTTTTTTTTPIVTTPTSTTTSTVTFTASQVLVDGSAQSVGFARLSGTVSARSGNTLGIEDATLTQSGATATLVPGTTLVNVGPSTLVTFFGQGVEAAISTQQISVGSVIEAFGTASNTSSGQVLLDATAGRVRLDQTSASGIVTVQGSSTLTLDLTSMGGRTISAFDFTGSGAAPTQYGVEFNPAPDLSNSTVGAPVIVSGFTNSFASASPNFSASSLLDPTTINAQLVADWSGGTASPFSSFDTSSIVLDPASSNFGVRHEILIGSQLVNLVGLASNPTITPATSSAGVFSIGHVVSSTVENFETYSAFITQLQTELNGTTLATGMTAIGQYTTSTAAFSATSITIFLNN